MRITECLLADITPGLKDLFMAYGLLLDEIEIEEVDEDEDLLALCSAKLKFRLEAMAIYYKREE